MLIYFEEGTTKIVGWNEIISQIEATKHIQEMGFKENKAKWIDDKTLIFPTESPGEREKWVPYYENNAIVFKAENIPIQPITAEEEFRLDMAETSLNQMLLLLDIQLNQELSTLT